MGVSSFCRATGPGAPGRRQQGFIAGLLLVLLALFSLVMWLVISASGAALALRLGIEFTGSGYARGVSGSLLQGLHIAEFHYRNDALQIEADGFDLRVDWAALSQGQARVELLQAHRLHVDLLQSEAADDDTGTDGGIPAWPELPLDIQAPHVTVGTFTLAQQGQPVPIQVHDFDAGLFVDGAGGRLDLRSIAIDAPDAHARIDGAVNLFAGQPITVDGALNIQARQSEYSADLVLQAQGNMDALTVKLTGAGEGMEVDAHANLAPSSAELPLASLYVRVKGLDPAAWVSGLPPALLSFTADLQLAGSIAVPDSVHAPPENSTKGAGADDTASSAAASAPASFMQRLQHLDAKGTLSIDEGSRWQNQALTGKAEFHLDDLRLPHVDVNLALGKNQVRIEGAAGALTDELRFDAKVPQPGALWPGLQGGGEASGVIRGMPEQHELNVTARVNVPNMPPQGSKGAKGDQKTPRLESIAPGQHAVVDADTAVDLPSVLQQGPVRLEVALKGSFQPADVAASKGAQWQGMVSRLRVANPDVTLDVASSTELSVQMGAGESPPAWSVGATSLRLSLPAKRNIVIQHRGSGGKGSGWHSAGSIDNLTPAWLVAQLPRSKDPLRVDVDWDLSAQPALSGTLRLVRRGGDIILPGDPALPLQLKNLELTVQAQPAQGGNSNVSFQANVVGGRLGRIAARGNTVASMRNGIPEVSEAQPVQVNVDLNVDDLGWVSAFVGDATEIGGKVAGNLRLARSGGVWDAAGTINGDDLRVVRVDDGIRLLNGTLRARFSDSQLVVDSLRFPGVIRTTPRNSRVQAWIAQNGKDGFIEASGSWSLESASGNAVVNLSQFPLVQRADRFIAGSGKVEVRASPRRLNISGKVQADAGWISLEGAEDLPSLDSDVVIVRTGQTREVEEALPMSLNLEIDLGKNVHLSGMGLNTALEGQLRIRNTRSGMRANGSVTTREGQFSIYGQTLVVDRGVITFQGLLDDPLLDIVAVRKGLQIEAGVQISGTARAPVITLVSFPDVPEVEKLSWLLLGRSPAASGADAGMLLSAAASLLGDSDSEPLYRQLGLDELGLRSGVSGGSRGLLPERTVVGDIKRLADSSEANQFLVIGKRLSDAIYVTFEQALTGRETVVRASYRISDRLTASVRGGTINGLELLWSFVFDD